MAIQLSEGLRNARLDAIETYGTVTASLRIYSGDQPATCASANSGTLLVHIDLPADWMAAASTGSKAKGAGAWQDASADGAGTAGHFRLYASQATMDGTTCFMQGDIPDDMTIDNAVIAVSQTVTITGFTLTDGNV